MKRSSKAFTHNIDSINLAEFDMGGVLHHARYFHLYERTREAFLESLGSPYPDLVQSGYHLAITESSQKFNAPVCFGDKLSIELQIVELGACSITFEYFVYKNANCIHHASTKHAAVKMAEDSKAQNQGSFKVAKIPKELLESLEPYFTPNKA